MCSDCPYASNIFKLMPGMEEITSEWIYSHIYPDARRPGKEGRQLPVVRQVGSKDLVHLSVAERCCEHIGIYWHILANGFSFKLGTVVTERLVLRESGLCRLRV